MPPSRSSETSSLVFFTYKRRKVVFARPATHEDALNLAKKTFTTLQGVPPGKIAIWASLANGREEWVQPEAWLTIATGVKHFTVEILEDKVKEEKVKDEEITVKIEKEEEDDVKMPFHTLQTSGSSAGVPTTSQSTVSPASADSAQEIWVYVKAVNGKTFIINNLQPSDTGYQLKTKVQELEGIPADQHALYFKGIKLKDHGTLAGLSITSGAVLDLFLQLRGGKPVIYLQPPVSINAKLRLSLVPQWKLSAVYPQPSEGSFKSGKSAQAVESEVDVSPSGMISTKGTSTEVAYIFWEAETEPSDSLPDSPPASPSSSLPDTKGLRAHAGFIPGTTKCSPADSVLLPVQEVPSYLEKALLVLGLHAEARTSFITYWLPSLLKHEHLALRFIPQIDYEAAAPLEIDPKPDVVTRVFMLFQGIPTDLLTDWEEARRRSLTDVGFWKGVVGVEETRRSNKNLFRVLEWGGMEVR